MSDPDGVLLPHGGYEHLRSFKVAEAVYDATVVFCDRFIDKHSRTHDQMVQAAYLLKRQLESQGRDFVEHGGFTERLYGARTQRRSSDRSDKSDASDSPTCPLCGKSMRQRTARKGPRAGQAFLGCSGYPDCRGTLPVSTSDRSDTSDPSGQETHP